MMKRSAVSQLRNRLKSATTAADPLSLLYCCDLVGNLLIVNRDSAINAVGAANFLTVLSHIYKWDFYDKGATIYFEVQDNRLFGGVYSSDTHAKQTRVLVASTSKDRLAPYIFTTAELGRFLSTKRIRS